MSQLGNNGMQKQIMVVIICPQKQKTYNIEVEADTTIGELGNELFSALDCQDDEQCVLYFNGQALENQRTFQDYGIMKGRQIEIKIEKKVQQPAQQYVQQPPLQQQVQQPPSYNNSNQGNNVNQRNNFIPSINEIILSVLVNTTQKKYQIKMMKNHQVRELTVKFTNEIKMPSTQKVTFVHAGKTLAEDKTFEYYGIPDQATINANIEAKGGVRIRI